MTVMGIPPMDFGDRTPGPLRDHCPWVLPVATRLFIFAPFLHFFNMKYSSYTRGDFGDPVRYGLSSHRSNEPFLRFQPDALAARTEGQINFLVFPSRRPVHSLTISLDPASEAARLRESAIS
jgi:hypothetical protein